MLRIKGMSKEEASEETRKIFEEQEKQYGSILNTAKVYGSAADDSKRRSSAASRHSRIRLDQR